MTWTTLKPDELAAARIGRAAGLRHKLATLPKIDVADLDARRARHAAVEALGRHLATIPDPARIKADALGTSVSMLGMLATSTSGLEGALLNWCTQVERRHGPAPRLTVVSEGADGYDGDERLGTLTGPRGLPSRYRIGWASGEAFGEGEDFDGLTLVVEVPSILDAEAMVAHMDAIGVAGHWPAPDADGGLPG